MAKVPKRSDRADILDRHIMAGDKALAPILLRARDQLELLITRNLLKGNFATSAAYRDRVFAAMFAEYKRLGGDLRKWSDAHVESIAREWHALGIDDIKRGARKVDPRWSTFSARHLRDISELVNPLNAPSLAAVRAAELPESLGGMLNRDIRILREAVVDVKRLQATAGLTARQTRAEMLKTVTDKRKTWAFIDRAGKRWDSKNYFAMLNRTISNNTARQTYATTVTDAGHDLAQIEGGIQGTCCDACAEWAGRIVSLTGNTPGYPTEADAAAGGVFHPRCRHYLGVVLDRVPGELKRAEAEAAAMRDREAERRAEIEAERKAKAA